MSDRPQKMWEVLLEEHYALTLPKCEPKSRSLEQMKDDCLAAAARQPKEPRDAVCLAKVYEMVHETARRGQGPPGSATAGKQALCLSGGGIRSATFNLGLLRGLACKEKLAHFDYLSTVSGGGFIGSWLSAWAHRTPNGISTVEGLLHPEQTADNKRARSASRVPGGNTGGKRARSERIDLAAEPREVAHLRDYSNYLTPRLGFLSSDTWALLATYPRNLLLNWLVIIPIVLSVILFFWSFELTGFALNQWTLAPVDPGKFPQQTIAFQVVHWTGLGLFLLGIATGIALAPRSDADEPSGRGPSKLRRRLLAYSGGATYFPLTLGILLLNLATPGLVKHLDPHSESFGTVVLVSVGTNTLLAVVALFVRKLLRANVARSTMHLVWEFIRLAFSINACSLIPVIVLWQLIHTQESNGRDVWQMYFWLSPVVRVAVLFLWFTLIVGLFGENPSPDYENGREWWARLTGILCRFATVYFGLYAAILVIPQWLDAWLGHAAHAARILSGGGLLAVCSAIYSIKAGQLTSNLGTFCDQNPELYRAAWKRLPGIAACLFLALSLISLSCVVRLAIHHWQREMIPTPSNATNWQSVLKALGLGLGFLSFAVALSWPININRFSLGGTYRSRLIRAYLGASRGMQRKPDPFTGFDAQDNMPMHFLRRGAVFTASEVNFSEAARLLCTRHAPFFHRVRESSSLNDCAEFDRLKCYPTLPEDAVKQANHQMLRVLNELLHDEELYEKTYGETDRSLIDPEIRAAHEQREADGCVRMLNRLIIEQQLNDGHDTWVIKPFVAKPFHVINATLNLVHGKRLAWQQRKAKSFVFTPLHSGFDQGYRSSTLYANGITLGGAMTISGAAAAPNMGYHSSPLLTMLMMLFNVRLGAWFGNPAYPGYSGILGATRDWLLRFPFIAVWPTWRLASPRFSFRSYLDEAFGRTSQINPYVYLSDGGHFDNLGLYEMVRRRCHLIVVSDASADLDRKFTDFGNAIQKIRIDMGIEIEIDSEYDGFLNPDKKEKSDYRVVTCTIRYTDADRANGVDGRLIYVKPAIDPQEPPDVYTYGRESVTFPHETTADQWFSESQFECYRLLGESIGKLIAEKIEPDAAIPVPPAPMQQEQANHRRSRLPKEKPLKK